MSPIPPDERIGTEDREEEPMTVTPLAQAAPTTEPSSFPPFTVTWAAVDRDLWSASTPGVFVGIVERIGRNRYRAVDAFGEELAVCATLDIAKARLLHPAGRGMRRAVQAHRERAAELVGVSA
jgi:hypothetical protein